ncbi:MAG: alpha/beta hydrolase [Desulfocapsaceae bacterium]
MSSRLFILFTLSALLTGCAYFRSGSEGTDTSGYSLSQVQADMRPIDLNQPYQPTENIDAYFNFYDLNFTNVQHWFGTVKSEGSTLAAHAFMPENPRGTLFLIHGYFDHTGTLSKLIAESLNQGYAVVTWDLPGHGLSSGDRTDTGQFHLCAEQFFDIVERSNQKLPHPMHVIAHSTGCSIAIEYLHNPDPYVFERMVFLAPLIRHTYWGLGKFGYVISKPFINQVRRRDKKNSNDEAYLAFVKKDPLHNSTLSYDYLGDLYQWEKKLRNAPVWSGSICVIQGDKDSIVKWKYNLPFMETKVENLEVHIIPGAKHQLANEIEAYRTQTFDQIFQYLEKP